MEENMSALIQEFYDKEFKNKKVFTWYDLQHVKMRLFEQTDIHNKKDVRFFSSVYSFTTYSKDGMFELEWLITRRDPSCDDFYLNKFVFDGVDYLSKNTEAA